MHQKRWLLLRRRRLPKLYQMRLMLSRLLQQMKQPPPATDR